MNEDNVLGIDSNSNPEKPKMSNSYKIITIIIVIVLLVIGSASLLVMGYFGNTRAATLYDGAKEYIYQANYERAKDKSKDAVELVNSNWLISSKLKDNINILDKKIDGYLLINKSRAVLGDGNVNEAVKLLKQGLLCSSDLEEEEKEYIAIVNTSRVEKANKDRIEEVLSSLMKEKNVTLNYKNLDNVSRLVSEEAGLCGIASIREVTYNNYYYIDLTTYDNKELKVYIGLDYRNDEMYKALYQNGKLDVALIVKQGLSIYATLQPYYVKRLELKDVLAQETSSNSNIIDTNKKTPPFR